LRSRDTYTSSKAAFQRHTSEGGEVTIIDPVILSLAVALGLGLLIGAERERRKGSGPSRSPAGIRTFAIASLAGAISVLVSAYWRGHEEDPGLTSEIALTATVLLGGLSMQHPAIAGGLAATVAIVLAAKSRLHRFVRHILTEDELEDALIFAGATLVVLPLVPNRPMGPYAALNPHAIWIVVILIMAISAAGYIAVRLLGAFLSPAWLRALFRAQQRSLRWARVRRRQPR
jgi:MgtC family protein